MKQIIEIIKYYIRFFKIKPIEKSNILFLSHTEALREIHNKKEYSYYKLYLVENSIYSTIIRIDKIKYFDHYVYLYSAWIWNRNLSIEKRIFLKFKEEDYDYLINIVKKEIGKINNPYYMFDFKKYDILEKILLKSKKENEIKFSIDFIFQYHSQKLFDLIDIVFSKDYNLNIKNYLSWTIQILFNYSSYKTLTKYYHELENNFNSDRELEKLKNILLEIIQEKNILEVKIDKIKEKFSI